ncbi:MAG: NFACT family protein [Oscillospiraceae bacterium]|nr:NFACT family protein [Oscillospiraceae bacterium]
MALDGITLHFLLEEIRAGAENARVEKIYQPAKDTLILLLRSAGGSRRLLITAAADAPRLHFTTQTRENPDTPPMLCMLLRKKLSGGRLMGVRQQGLDRTAFLDFEATNDLGDRVRLSLCVEIMGRHSNIILLDEEERIVDAVKRITPEISSVRSVLPGMRYTPPPARDQISLLECSCEELVERICGTDAPLSKAILKYTEGVSPIIAQEGAFYTQRGRDESALALTGEERDRLTFYLRGIQRMLTEKAPRPTLLCETNGKPRDFAFLPCHQYGHLATLEEYPDFSSMLDDFYRRKFGVLRKNAAAEQLLKVLSAASDKVTRRVAVQREELKECAEREQFRKWGDILSANVWQLAKGMHTVTLPDIYSETGEEITIPLDPALSPRENIQKCYKEYKKLDKAERMLTRFVAEGQQEITYLDSVFDALSRATSEAELTDIKAELRESGYLRERGGKGKEKKRPPLPFESFCSSDGFSILAGRNNIQNDTLSLKKAAKSDMWFHVGNIPGSHVVIECGGRSVPDRTLEEAAVIAATRSRAAESRKVRVDLTEVRNVRKPSGARPGMVIYENFRSVFVDPDPELCRRLAEKKE